MIVELTTWEILTAGLAGLMRVVENIKLRRKNRWGETDIGNWERHIEGALAECALAKHNGAYWRGKGELRGSDVGARDEVRATWRENGHLILHPDDKDDSRYWLLVGLNGRYEIKGWILGSVGKNQKYWHDIGNGRPCYWVPQNHLTV